jgi:hypothetical protein
MKTSLCHQREHGLTLVELCVLIACVAIFWLVFMSLVPTNHSKARALRIQCVNNLKQTGLAFSIWAGDHSDKYPMEISETNGGTMEFITGTNLFRHFQVMSNELSTPKVLLCPADDDSRTVVATNFGSDLFNSHISFFIGLDTSSTNAQGLLSGDRNLTNGTPIRNGILEVRTNQPPGWTAGTHVKVGNLLMADGSVQQVSQVGLRQAVENAGPATNHLQMPVLTP